MNDTLVSESQSVLIWFIFAHRDSLHSLQLFDRLPFIPRFALLPFALCLPSFAVFFLFFFQAPAVPALGAAVAMMALAVSCPMVEAFSLSAPTSFVGSSVGGKTTNTTPYTYNTNSLFLPRLSSQHSGFACMVSATDLPLLDCCCMYRTVHLIVPIVVYVQRMPTVLCHGCCVCKWAGSHRLDLPAVGGVGCMEQGT